MFGRPRGYQETGTTVWNDSYRTEVECPIRHVSRYYCDGQLSFHVRNRGVEWRGTCERGLNVSNIQNIPWRDRNLYHK